MLGLLLLLATSSATSATQPGPRGVAGALVQSRRAPDVRGRAVDGSPAESWVRIRLDANATEEQVELGDADVLSSAGELDELRQAHEEWAARMRSGQSRRVRLARDFVLTCKEKQENGQCVPGLSPNCNLKLDAGTVGVVEEVRGPCEGETAWGCGPVVSFARFMQPQKMLWADLEPYELHGKGGGGGSAANGASDGDSNVYAVLGASNRVARLVASRLQEMGRQVRRTTLHAPAESGKGEAAAGGGDYGVHFGSVSGLLSVLKGVDVALVLVPIQFQASDVYVISRHFAENLARACTFAGVRRVVLLSNIGAQFDPESGGLEPGLIGLGHILEEAFKDFDGSVVTLRMSYLMENFADFVSHVQEERMFPTLLSPAYKKFDMVSAVDVATEAVKLMVSFPHGDQRRRACVELEGRAVSPHDVAFAFTKKYPLDESTGKETVLSASLPPGEWDAFLRGTSSSPDARQRVKETFAFMNKDLVRGEGFPKCDVIRVHEDVDGKVLAGGGGVRLRGVEEVVMGF